MLIEIEASSFRGRKEFSKLGEQLLFSKDLLKQCDTHDLGRTYSNQAQDIHRLLLKIHRSIFKATSVWTSTTITDHRIYLGASSIRGNLCQRYDNRFNNHNQLHISNREVLFSFPRGSFAGTTYYLHVPDIEADNPFLISDANVLDYILETYKGEVDYSIYLVDLLNIVREILVSKQRITTLDVVTLKYFLKRWVHLANKTNFTRPTKIAKQRKSISNLTKLVEHMGDNPYVLSEYVKCAFIRLRKEGVLQ